MVTSQASRSRVFFDILVFDMHEKGQTQTGTNNHTSQKD